MVRRDNIIEIKIVEELALSVLLPTHHGAPPNPNASNRRNHGSQLTSSRVLQHNPPESGHQPHRLECLLCAQSRCLSSKRDWHIAMPAGEPSTAS
jgi:hypothetical protein